MQGQRVVIIGGSSGIGLATAIAAQRAGAGVVIASHSEPRLAAAQQHFASPVTGHVLDIANEAAVRRFFQEVDGFDHLVVTANQPAKGPFLELPTEDARQHFAVKFWGQYYAARYGAPKVRAGGSITLFAGFVSEKPLPGLSATAAVNGALSALIKSLAVELAPLRINAVSPGIIETPAYGEPSEQRTRSMQAMGEQIPVGRVGQPEDVAQSVLYLMQNGFTTGNLLFVDGGHRFV